MSDWKKELRELVELKDMGALTQEQFEAKRDRIIAKSESKEPHGSEPSISIDSTIGNYHILSLIGEGGMGKVYLGRHKEAAFAKAQGDVAIKIMHPQLANDENFRERFIQEAALGETISHPNIANVRELLTTGHLGLVMEYIEGKELSSFLQPQGLLPQKVISYLQPLAEALDVLHSRGIIHRDMKPDNVKIRPNGSPVILDFGIAKQQNAGQGMTRTGTAMGTIAYMAPEQMNAKNVTGAADQYSLAMMAYELLSGAYPWGEEDTEFQVTNLKLSDKLPALLTHKTDISSAISDVVQKGMSSKAEDRYGSCSAFVAALSEAVKSASQEQPTPRRRKRPHTVMIANSDPESSAPEKPQPQPKPQPKSSEQPRRSPRPSTVLVEPPKPEEKAAPEAPSPEVTAPKSKMGLVVGGVLGLVLVVGGGVMLMQPPKEVTLQVDGTTKAVLVPADEFTMGCTPEQRSDCFSDEKPSHSVLISRSFYMMKSEVTQELYQKVMGNNPSEFSYCEGDCPVESVTWFDAVSFANNLSAKEGLEACYNISGETVTWSKGVACKGWRLPTEAEWEYAARGGQSTKYAGSNRVGRVAWNYNNSGDETHAVCSKLENGYGLCDMSGNVWEWVWDWKGTYSDSSKVDPLGPSSGTYRVLRGGSFHNFSGDFRVSRRVEYRPVRPYGHSGGFRVLRTFP